MEGSGSDCGAAPGPAAAPGGEGEGCEGLWELPVECCERRPVCGRCRWQAADANEEAGVIQIIKWKKKCSIIVLVAPSTSVSDTMFYVAIDS